VHDIEEKNDEAHHPRAEPGKKHQRGIDGVRTLGKRDVGKGSPRNFVTGKRG